MTRDEIDRTIEGWANEEVLIVDPRTGKATSTKDYVDKWYDEHPEKLQYIRDRMN